MEPIKTTSVAPKPYVTIGMVVYNGEAYLRRAIESLLCQSYRGFRLIISDNASTDSTEDLCREFEERDSRVTYIRKTKNIGPIHNFWSVLEMAETPYFMWAAHDDWWEPTYIEALKSRLDANPNIGLACSWVNVVHPDTCHVIKSFRPESSPSSRPLINYLMELFAPCVNKYYGLYRTEILKSFDYNKYFLFDYQDTLLIDFINLNTKVSVVTQYLFNYSEIPGKVRQSLDPRVQLISNNFLKRVYRFNHLAYVLAVLRLIFDSNLYITSKLMASSMFLFMFVSWKLRHRLP